MNFNEPSKSEKTQLNAIRKSYETQNRKKMEDFSVGAGDFSKFLIF